MEGGSPVPLAAWDVHGFHTTADLNIERIMEDASTRWLRPNEIYAILSNYTHFKIQPQPLMNPEGGKLLLFDRNMLRNFRKDGHNWRKKKDGKTVQEAHEKLKIGTEERIHVYYARSEDDPNFYRRCYWLLDRDLERIVLVHYRHTLEDYANQQVSTAVECHDNLPLTNTLRHCYPLTPLNSTSGSSHVDTSGSVVLSEEINSKEDYAICAANKSTEVEIHDLALDMINEFDWGSLVVVEPQTSNDFSASGGGNVLPLYQKVEHEQRSSRDNSNILKDSSCEHPNRINTSTGFIAVNQPLQGYLQPTVVDQNTISKMLVSMNTNAQGTDFQMLSTIPGTCDDGALQTQNSFGQWDYIVDDVPGSLHDLQLGSQVSDVQESKALAVADNPCGPEQVFNIKDISPSWSCAHEETKVIVIGHFHESHKHLGSSNVFFVFGDIYVPAEMIQHGVYRSMVLPYAPGLVNFYLSLDGQTPISQVMKFEFRPAEGISKSVASSHDVDIDEFKQKDFEILIRLVRLLFSASNNISILANGISANSLKGVKRFLSVTSPSLEKDWLHLLKLVGNKETSFLSVNHHLLELVLKNKLQEWLLTKVAEGCRTTDLDNQGLGVIHLCAILDYTWAAHLFKASGLSLDFRDAFGWTALHWAAYCGSMDMVAALLSSGANPSLVTDPTAKFPGGCTAADLASQEGYEGLGAYLAEKALTAHFEAMTLSGNVTAPAAHISTEPVSSENIESGSSEQEVLLKYSIAAYRNAADAADRINSAFRERFLKLQVKAAQLANSEAEATYIVSALKIQKAFRTHSRRKMMKAAARIQGTYRTWQARKNFLNMRRQVTKIQAVYRGHLVRRQYRKILWSVGVLEKAVLRWRLKRKGLRGLQVESVEASRVVDKGENCIEEDFYRISQQQAEERVNRSVVRVQAMFRSHRTQQEYRKMKLAHDKAKLEFNEFANSGQS
uniref:Calmodulin-binding transcription activator 5 n=1 Tax=Anthurium amnicola TaxID=1678845 RepID=A0A1D1Z889_9ARAE